jgi:hypothetical protein
MTMRSGANAFETQGRYRSTMIFTAIRSVKTLRRKSITAQQFRIDPFRGRTEQSPTLRFEVINPW